MRAREEHWTEDAERDGERDFETGRELAGDAWPELRSSGEWAHAVYMANATGRPGRFTRSGGRERIILWPDGLVQAADLPGVYPLPALSRRAAGILRCQARDD